MLKLTFARKLMAAAACAAVMISPVQAADKVHKLKLAETWPTNFGVFSEPARRMADLANKMSNDRYRQQAQVGAGRVRYGACRTV
jgi:TRAP-type mannitol/chloroaromatic compound transport system substrate-binding protein